LTKIDKYNIIHRIGGITLIVVEINGSTNEIEIITNKGVFTGKGTLNKSHFRIQNDTVRDSKGNELSEYDFAALKSSVNDFIRKSNQKVIVDFS